ncbi:N2227-like protein-domain-containing protein [Lipomyces kononenkoae]|uniref:N2227-like protein-domain-containing protein n=1 Tax=Lipomyces kononenkoae TaxID=34357 RepID=A0ACC3SZT4_LIPKO
MPRPSIASDTNERRALLDAVAGLQNYVSEMKQVASRRRLLFSRMSARHQRLAKATGYSRRLQDIDKAVTGNGEITARIAKLAERDFNVTRAELLHSRPVRNARVIELLKHFVRDWSEVGDQERSLTFPPILDALQAEFGNDIVQKRVLVPGAGVGRLAYDISQLGCQTEANEYSYLMHLGNIFVLEQSKNSCAVYPHVHNFSHQISGKGQLRPVMFPDVEPENRVRIRNSFGDFMKLSGSHNLYDAIATLYFIDTAENMLTYIDTIRQLLPLGGIWLNCGPLKWGSSPRVEFTLEEVLSVISNMGFQIEKRWSRTAEYTADSESLWQGFYGVEGWLARKVEE